MRRSTILGIVILVLSAGLAPADEPTASAEMEEAVKQFAEKYNATSHPYIRAEVLLGTKTFDEPAFVDFLIDVVQPTGDKRHAFIIRHAAAEKLSQLRTEAALHRAIERLKTHRQAHVKVFLVHGLGRSPSALAEAGILQALQDTNKDVKTTAAAYAHRVKDVAVIPLLIELLGYRYKEAHLDAWNALTRLTGCRLAIKQDPWEEWWEKNREKVTELPVPKELQVEETIYTWPMVEDFHFGCRTPSGKAKALRTYGPRNRVVRARISKAIGDGLEWLSKHQAVQGYWDVDEFWVTDPKYAGVTLEDITKKDEDKLFQDDKPQPGIGKTGPAMDLPATGLALMAFCGNGYTHRQGKYRKTVQAATDWMLTKQNEKTGAFSNNMYIHSICTHALVELWGTTRDLELKPAAQKAVDFLCWAQTPRAGWRYSPRSPTTDSSVTSWCSMALQTSYRAGLDVPAQNLIWCRQFWDKVTVYSGGEGGKEFGQAFYELKETGEHGGSGSAANTAASILCRIFMGTLHRARSVKAGAASLDDVQVHAMAPEIYMWFYATQGLFQMGGSQWDRWEKEVMPAVLKMQEQPDRRRRATGEEGSFYAPTKWIGTHLGRVGVTACCCIILETYYFYPRIKNE